MKPRPRHLWTPPTHQPSTTTLNDDLIHSSAIGEVTDDDYGTIRGGMKNDHTHGQKRFEIAVSREADHYADAEAPLRLRRRPDLHPG